jgi:large subunit ribosomal protein L2
MGKRIIVQARGKGGNAYRVKRNAFKYEIKYPRDISGKGEIIKLLNSPGHSSPLAKVKHNKGVFYIPAFRGMIEGQEIQFYSKEIKEGNIMELKDIPLKTKIYNLESRPRDGGVLVRTAGSSAEITRKVENNVFVLMPSKKEKKFSDRCRATVGVIAGAGRLEKPIVKAGKNHHIKKARNKLWPRTSAVKMNAIDHPFGSGRGKNPKSKIAKRNSPPGAKVGHLRPRRTGHRR